MTGSVSDAPTYNLARKERTHKSWHTSTALLVTTVQDTWCTHKVGHPAKTEAYRRAMLVRRLSYTRQTSSKFITCSLISHEVSESLQQANMPSLLLSAVASSKTRTNSKVNFSYFSACQVAFACCLAQETAFTYLFSEALVRPSSWRFPRDDKSERLD